MPIHPIWDNFPEIKEDLVGCYALMEKKVRIRNKDIQEAIFDLLNGGGKLLRPAYFILFSRFGNLQKQDHKKLLYAASSVEMLHIATLVHDDIIDDSPTRRGTQSIQSKFGKDIAVYTGDFLFTVYFDLLAHATDSTAAVKLNAFAMKRILLGELDQMHQRYNMDITLRQYLRSISGKTAQLFSLSCFEGAKWGFCSPSVIISSRHIGHHIGIAYQMLDDILDYTQNSETLAKPVLEDVKQGVYSLPLILAMRGHKEAFEPLLRKGKDMTPEDTQQVVHLIEKYHGTSKAQQLAQRYTDKALNGIQALPDRPEKKILYRLTEELLYRNF
ncbi:heptaprenyl diphosphate synthase [Pisciglobus halotolerans]|uniref:Heptaprenyl diphosphate synthase n=1 Tax=Pisciglobus halotolerans TaxID=745365 RepID=A0A1I3CE57_9LACT|nr:heptaprenyl diphosphate synthase [Pisciglobus halotolerans]